jgi:hypothetical protein
MTPDVSTGDISVQVARLIIIVERLEQELRTCMQQVIKTQDDHESRIRCIERDDPWVEQCNRLASILEKLEARVDAIEKRQDKQAGVKEFLPWIISIGSGLIAIYVWIREI